MKLFKELEDKLDAVQEEGREKDQQIEQLKFDL